MDNISNEEVLKFLFGSENVEKAKLRVLIQTTTWFILSAILWAVAIWVVNDLRLSIGILLMLWANNYSKVVIK